MAGVTEKGNNGLFSNEIEFNGKYATYVRFLKEEVGIFQTFREAYVIGAIVGFLNNVMGTEDNSEKVQSASVFPNELSKKKIDLRFIYRTIMLLKEEDGYTLDDYTNRAFRDDPEENAQMYKANMRLFNAYVCGGIEYLYNMFQNVSNINDAVDILYEFLHDFSVDIGLLEMDGLPSFDPEF